MKEQRQFIGDKKLEKSSRYFPFMEGGGCRLLKGWKGSWHLKHTLSWRDVGRVRAQFIGLRPGKAHRPGIHSRQYSRGYFLRWPCQNTIYCSQTWDRPIIQKYIADNTVVVISYVGRVRIYCSQTRDSPTDQEYIADRTVVVISLLAVSKYNSLFSDQG